MVETILKQLENYAKREQVPIVLSETKELLMTLSAMKKPEKVLEIGTAIGYSSILIKYYSQNNCKIDTIDNDYDRILIARENIEKVGYTNDINIIYGDATEVLSSLTSKYDMIFIDAAKNQYNEYLAYSLKLLNDNAVLIADNVLYRGIINNTGYVKRRNRTILRTLRKFISDIKNDTRLTSVVLDIGDGVSVSVFKENKE